MVRLMDENEYSQAQHYSLSALACKEATADAEENTATKLVKVKNKEPWLLLCKVVYYFLNVMNF